MSDISEVCDVCKTNLKQEGDHCCVRCRNIINSFSSHHFKDNGNGNGNSRKNRYSFLANKNGLRK